MARMARRLVAGIALLEAGALVSASCACQREDARAAWDGGGSAAPLGTWSRARGYDLRATAVRDCSASDAATQAPDRRRLTLDVELLITGTEPVPVNAFYARLVDAEGREYRAELGGCEPVLRGSPLGPGESRQGAWTFEVPSRARNLELVYRPRLLDAAADSTSRVAIGSP